MRQNESHVGLDLNVKYSQEYPNRYLKDTVGLLILHMSAWVCLGGVLHGGSFAVPVYILVKCTCHHLSRYGQLKTHFVLFQYLNITMYCKSVNNWDTRFLWWISDMYH